MGEPVIWGSLLGVGLGLLILAVFKVFIPILADALTALEEHRLNKKIPRDSVWRLGTYVVSKRDGLIIRIHHIDGEQVHIRPLSGCEPLMLSYKYFLENATRIPEEDLPLIYLAELP